MPGLPRRRRTLALITATAALLAGSLLWITLQPSQSGQAANAPVSRIDTQPRACLATAATSNRDEVERAWTGLLGAVKQHPTLVIQRFTGAASISNTTFLNTLTQMRCTVVVAVGDALSKATGSIHSGATRFVTITATSPPTGAIANLPAASATPDQVREAVLKALNGS